MMPLLGFCRASREGELFELIAAVQCSGAHEFEEQVRAEIALDGYWLHWASKILPADVWIKEYPEEWGEVLFQSIQAGCPVVLGPIQRISVKPEVFLDRLKIKRMQGIEPLDAQFGQEPKKTLPDELHTDFFGEVYPSQAEVVHYGSHIPPMATYAVLDATKLPWLLPDLLENSELRYQSLLQGEAQVEIANHAPYLVELKEGNAFTRQLFTGAKGIHGLWEKSLGIFIRTRSDFAELRHHLRRFTRLQNEHGKWFYFRFWEKTSLPALLEGKPVELAEALLQDVSYQGLILMLPIPEDGKLIICQRQEEHCSLPLRPPKIMDDLLTAFNAEVSKAQDVQEVQAVLAPFSDTHEGLCLPSSQELHETLKRLKSLSFSNSEMIRKALHLYVRACLQDQSDQALALLNNVRQGPAIRLWHLANLVKD